MSERKPATSDARSIRWVAAPLFFALVGLLAANAGVHSGREEAYREQRASFVAETGPPNQTESQTIRVDGNATVVPSNRLVALAASQSESPSPTQLPRASQPSEKGTMPDAPASPAHDPVRDMQTLWSDGVRKLQLSSCSDAAISFNKALGLVEQSSITSLDRTLLACDMGFALICSREFQRGIELLRESLGEDLGKWPSYLVNVAGFGYFSLGDYWKARAVFEDGTRVDPFNPLLWNNLAAARMLSGDLQGADDAMYHALEHRGVHFKGDDNYHTHLFVTNIQVLQQFIGGERHLKPHVEVWYKEGVQA